MSNDFSLDCPHCHKSYREWNFTHNLAIMAEAAGIYQVLWHPNKECSYSWEDDWIEYQTAKEMLPILQAGYDRMLLEPDHYKSFEPSNKWGTYEGFLGVISEIIAACKEFPDSRPHAHI